MSNHIRRFKRPEYIAHRDFTPIECLPDDCLLQRLRGRAAVEGRHAGGRAATGARAEPAGVGRHEPLRQAARARSAGQAAARRPDRRRQIRRDVSRAGAASTPGVHLVAASPTSSPAARARISRASAGSPSATRRRSLDAALATRHDARRRRLAGAGRASADRHRRRVHGQSDRRGRALPRRLSRTASTSSTSRSRPTRSAGRCSRAGPREAGVVYSLAYGDQPALICDLVDWARACGFPCRRRGARPQVAAALRAVDAGDGLGLLRPDARAGARRRPQSEDVQLASSTARSRRSSAPRCATRPGSRRAAATAWPIRRRASTTSHS